jgi:hypothetical protein
MWEVLMTTDEINNIVLWLNTVGLVIGSISALVLALLSKVFITINPDGTQSWGIPKGMSGEEWQAKNCRLRRTQQWVIPAAYLGILIGFVAQLVALWLPSVLG